MVLSVSTQAFAQAPVEERSTSGGTGLAQQRVEFTRQAMERADAQVRDALADRKQAASRFDAAKAALDEADKALAKAKSAAAEAKRAYERESSEFDRQRRAGESGR